MELSIRTPYNTILSDFTGFSRVLTKTNEAALVIQNRSPPSVYILPPGQINIKMNQEAKDSLGNTVSGHYLHTGGWCIVGVDNTCQISLTDAFQKQDVRIDQFEKGTFNDGDNAAGRYAAKIRKACARVFTKRAV
ncbi:hypothetical protein PPERSA_07956 [Pseudocohnilembus persalinus]|uniref:Uncharacterized protein n=1 Tax=Pseudocohnilembus persalinus TaxID=266149 RepID=A0A0V0QBG0_PSEPJ|nr:hypothetical protein PPERSA_07956 [Pseudocohnilembus persalinus]|eukprot:KRW99471.1 hypothetical protein PPERSA_07956 [Pseudocohnilembus persalinus]